MQKSILASNLIKETHMQIILAQLNLRATETINRLSFILFLLALASEDISVVITRDHLPELGLILINSKRTV